MAAASSSPLRERTGPPCACYRGVLGWNASSLFAAAFPSVRPALPDAPRAEPGSFPPPRLVPSVAGKAAGERRLPEPPPPGAGVRPGRGALPPRRRGSRSAPPLPPSSRRGTSLPRPCAALREQRSLPESRYVPFPSPPQPLPGVPVADGLRSALAAGGGRRALRTSPQMPGAGAEPGHRSEQQEERAGGGRERGRQGRSRTLTLQSPPGGQAEGDGPHDDAPASTALQRSHQREADAPGGAFKWLGRPARPDPGGCLPQASPSLLSLLVLPLPPRRRGCSQLPPAAAPGRSPASHPAILRSALEMQLAEEGKALPGRRPSPSREMSAMGGRGAAQPCPTLPMPGRSLEPGAEPRIGTPGRGGWF